MRFGRVSTCVDSVLLRFADKLRDSPHLSEVRAFALLTMCGLGAGLGFPGTRGIPDGQLPQQ